MGGDRRKTARQTHIARLGGKYFGTRGAERLGKSVSEPGAMGVFDPMHGSGAFSR